MTLIYKNFAEEFKALSHTRVGERMTLVGNQRAYVIEGKPYFGNVHFPRVSESWMTHETLQKHFRSNTKLHGRIWGGTAGEVNLSYMAVSKAPAAILFDINPFQTLFWNSFFELLGQNPDPHLFAASSRQFLKDFYFDLSRQFNLKALQEDNPGLHLESPDPKEHMVSVEEQIQERKAINSLFDLEEEDYSDIIAPRCLDDVEKCSSPIKNMSYKNFYQAIRTYLGWKSTGSISCADKDVQWIANIEHYTHLHLMAKNNAIAAITLDVSDTPSCNQLKEHMNNVAYNPIEIEDDKIVEKTARQGARIENIYLSNVLYYLNHSVEEIKECLAKGEKPRDFCGHEVSTCSYATTLENIRSLTDENAAVLRFDDTKSGFMGRPDFEPLFSLKDEDNIHIPSPNEPAGLGMSLAQLF